MSSAHPRLTVLLAEDSEDDAFFFRWSLRKAALSCHLVHVWNGEEARRYLAQASPFGGGIVRRPDLVFLDLKMPTLSGFEVLAWLREHPFDPPLDVAILSGSEHASDVERARALGASGYYPKPISIEHLQARFARARERSFANSPALAPSGDPART